MRLKSTSLNIISNTLIFTVFTFLSGCVTAPSSSIYQPAVVYSNAPLPPLISNSPPPAPKVEVISESPVQGYFWVSGTWLWKNARYVWQPGYWTAPRPGYTWKPHQWHAVGQGWRMDGGHWIRH